MAYLYNFCFYFSLRLGSIIIGGISFIQSFAIIILLAIGLNNISNVSNQIQVWIGENDLIFTASIFEMLQADPEKYWLIGISFFSVHAFSCILLIYGAYVCNTFAMYPYILSEFIRLAFLFAGHVIAMMLVKQNIINLGLLIGLSIFGGFILLGLIYMWFCVLNLVQVIKQLLREIEITDITNFPQQPIAHSDVFTVRNKYQFNY